VHTLNSTVEVLGTSFDVHTDSLQVLVSVIKGKVAFYASDNTENRIELTQDHSGIFELKSEILVQRNSIDYNQLAWHTGKFNFQHMPLKQACHVLADFYNLKLQVVDQDIQFVDSVNGDFNINSLDSIINNINPTLTEDIRIYAIGNQLVVSKQ
jgi:ferric-dicitrate binding protein FerR (iron transport regulator)